VTLDNLKGSEKKELFRPLSKCWD